MKGLGELERAVMEIVWSSGAPVSVRDVAARLPDRAYTTVMTVLDRLARKNVVKRSLNGKAWRYTAALSREEFVARLMLDVLSQAGSRDAALVHFARAVGADTLRNAITAGEPGEERRR